LGRKTLISQSQSTSAPHQSIFTGRMLFLTPNQWCRGTEDSVAK